MVEIATGDLRTPGQLRTAQALTLEAMREAPTSSSRRRSSMVGGAATPTSCSSGRIVRAPPLGEWSYDIGDTKLARSVKGGAILQMCVYADLLEGLQGIAPEWLYVITGDACGTPSERSDFAAYFRYVRAGSTPGSAAGLADPGRHLPGPRGPLPSLYLVPECIDRRRDDDHLSIVAGMRRVDTERPDAAGVSTMASLARPAARRACRRVIRPQLARDPRTGAAAGPQKG